MTHVLRLRSLSRWRLAAAAALATLALGLVIVLAYELALARVPQHRAALESLVRSETGLDMRFDEMSLRWGWYGPEAVFRQVELENPATAATVLRAPQLVVSIDTWRTLRSGRPEAGRISVVAPEIDLTARAVGTGVTAGLTTARPADRAAPPALSWSAQRLEALRILQHWRGGRIDLEGGTLRLDGALGAASPLSLQLRRASLNREDKEWRLAAFVLLPPRLGRTAQVVMRASGDPSEPAGLSGALHLDARRLVFAAWHDVLDGMEAARYVPRAGSGDLELNVDFTRGHIDGGNGSVRAGGLIFAAQGGEPLTLGTLRGEWRLARRDSGWRVRMDSLELGHGAEPRASLVIDVAAAGERARGTLERAPLVPFLAVSRWLMPQLDLAGTRLEGVARNVSFDWDARRPVGQRLQLGGRLEDVTLVPRSGDFELRGFGVRLTGNETHLRAELRSHAASLQLAQSRQGAVDAVRVGAELRIDRLEGGGWRIAADDFLLERAFARLKLSGSLRANGTLEDPQIDVRGTLTGAEISLLERLLGESTQQAFGAAASHLTAGRVRAAEFELRGPLGELPFGAHGARFEGSLTLEDGAFSADDLWPAASGIEARVEWRGARIQAAITAGRAGDFALTDAHAEWDATAAHPTHLTGRVTGRLESAIDWLSEHPQLREFAPSAQNMNATGMATFDLNVSIPPSDFTAPTSIASTSFSVSAAPRIRARVATSIESAQLQIAPALPPLEGVSGSFVFDGGHLRRSTLTGAWLGGPVTLQVGERRERGQSLIAIEVAGVASAARVAELAGAGRLEELARQAAGGQSTLINLGVLEEASWQGSVAWSGELTTAAGALDSLSPWRLRLESNLSGLSSKWPEPFTKRAGAPLALSMEAVGADDVALLHASLGDRVRSVFALRRDVAGYWSLDRGAVRLGAGSAVLPAQSLLFIQGHLNRLDLPAYLLAWQALAREGLPAVRAQIAASEVTLAGGTYARVSLQAERTASGTQLTMDSSALSGSVHWPLPDAAGTAASATTATMPPAGVRLSRLELTPETDSAAALSLLAQLAPQTEVDVQELFWEGRPIGRLTGLLQSQRDRLLAEDIRLASDSFEASGNLRCRSAAAGCQLGFTLTSHDAAATLADFGFRPDVSAASATLQGDLGWRPVAERPWIAGVHGSLSYRLEDGSTRDLKAASEQSPPFALLAIPAFVTGLERPGPASQGAAAPLPQPLDALPFSRLEGDFELRDGLAVTTDLHFDGDAEILVRGRTDLVARDYDAEVQVLRGQERLPAAIRRFFATPRVAAAWFSLRELFASGLNPDPHADLRLQGTWDAPMVVAVN